MRPTLSYQGACRSIRAVASARQEAFNNTEEVLPLTEAVGRVINCDVLSPVDTPIFDSSAMDGYAVNSAHTMHASSISPIILKVQGCMMAGDPVMEVQPGLTDGFAPCVEIMTGAAFPAGFDACIPFEQAFELEQRSSSTLNSYVQVLLPASSNQHRRLAGSDYRKGDLIIGRGSVIDPRHCLAAASVGIQSLAVLRKLQVAVLSTGSELQSSRTDCSKEGACTISDANGPYLVSAIQSLGAEVSFVDTVPDSIDATMDCLRQLLQTQSLDIIISTGAVSAGKLDLIPQVIATLEGRVHFHHVAMRPGHPVLFASLPGWRHAWRSEDEAEPCQMSMESNCARKRVEKEVAFFGLPGNPIAAATSLRFLVKPYISEILRTVKEPYIPARIVKKGQSSHESAGTSNLVVSNPKQLDQFRHGRLIFEQNSSLVELSSEQSPAKIKPFAEANCWVHIPQHMAEVFEGDLVYTYLL